MAKYEAFPAVSMYGIGKEAATWNVVKRESDGSVATASTILASFHGPAAEKDAKCHAAKLNERESGAAYPERYDGSREVEEAVSDKPRKTLREELEVHEDIAPARFSGLPE